jgi:hypothetical protein
MGAPPPIAARKPGQTVVAGSGAVTSAASPAIVFPGAAQGGRPQVLGRTPEGGWSRSAGRIPFPEDRGSRHGEGR